MSLIVNNLDIIIPILKMRKIRLREVKWLVQSGGAKILMQNCVLLEPKFLTTMS